MSTKTISEKSIIRRLSGVSIIGNTLLAAFKLIAGVLGHSSAMISDAVHSLSDVFTTFIAYLGVRLSNKEPDKAHPYGHDRFECVASLLLAVLLIGTGAGIGFGGLKTIISGNYDSIAIPSTIALIADIVSIVTK